MQKPAAKRERKGDNLTGKQNSSTTLGTSRCGRSRLPSLTTSECDQIRGRSEQPRSGLPFLTTTECDQVLGPDHIVAIHIKMSQVSSMSFVYLSSCHPFALFLLLVFAYLLESHWKMSAFGSGLFHENFTRFHPLLPLQKATFVFCLVCPPSRWPPFAHSSTKMGSLDIDTVYSTLCPSITSTRSTSKFYFNMFQYIVGGAVMSDAITYGQDCMWKSIG